ncbi:helix-turn-helix transcriptional regulator [Tomitella fengzijianii]|uniref:Helix-turn-helix transcriptional regulator n=2 Tax=Tomitella fengzijianii TaxID=2597660 RepID=A0A516X7H8_9ACTN|nr:helix-turn-helix transcriptional regulator [Tomitella fengzijianii]
MRAGMSQASLAAAAGTSRSTLSAYERGRKSPTLATAARIIDEAGQGLVLIPQVRFRQVFAGRGRPIIVPSCLPRLPVERALAIVRLPLHLNWSDKGRSFDLSDRRQRARVYETVLREGTETDILEYIDGVLLIDLWDELVLPAGVREEWSPLVRGRGVAA